MARIRTIKPEFHSHEELSALPAETHLFASALVNYADDEGYFNANPVLVKAGTNPLRNDGTAVEKMLAQLEEIDYIEVRRSGAKHYGKICNFDEHQRVSHKVLSKIKDRFEALQNYSGEAPDNIQSESGEAPVNVRPELNRRELNRREASAVISPDMVARGVLTELGLSGRDLLSIVEEVCRSQVKFYGSPGELRDAMVAAWRDYEVSKPELTYTKGAKTFFGEGDWRNKAGWPWKAGSQPNEVKPITAAEKMRRVS